jgi:hypothetical protein
VLDSERRTRLVSRHRLGSAKAESPEEVAGALIALHATGPAAVHLSTWARMRDMRVGDMERALYEDRSLVRMLGMRRTVFVVASGLVPVVNAACTRAIAERERTRLVGFLEAGGIATDGASWLSEVEEAALAALRLRGEAAAAELSRDVPGLRAQLLMAAGKPWEGVQGVSTRVLFLLAADGRIVRGRPRGSWVSSQYRWAPIESWLPAGVPELPVEEAQAALARLWLGAYGPGTAADLRWWTGWTARETGRALAALGAVEVELEHGRGYMLADDLEQPPVSAPAAAFLPSLDPTIMGWSERTWFLGPHYPALFDRSGNPGPTIWWDGRVVGGWGQKAGEVVYRLLEDVGQEAQEAIEADAARLNTWLAGTRVPPPFRTPLEKSLGAD